jgi:hypothetical protein
MAAVSIIVDSVGTTTASGRVNFFNANPSIGSDGWVSFFVNLNFEDAAQAAQNNLGQLSWSLSGLTPNTTYDLDALGDTDIRFSFFDGSSSAVYATSVSITTDPQPINAQFIDSNFGGTLRVGTFYNMTVSARYSNNINASGYPSSLSPTEFTSGEYHYFSLQGTISSSDLSGSSSTYNVSMTAFAADGIGNSDSASDTLTVKDGYPDISGSLDSSMRVGEFYSDSLSKNTYARSVSNSGTITSNGLSFSNSSLTLSGTPVSDGTYSISVTGQNNSFETDTYNQTFTVLPRIPVWTDNTISTSFTVDEPYSDSINATYAAAYEVTSGSLPAGVSLDSNTGSLSGTPTTPDQYIFTLGARNTANEFIYTQQYNVTVQETGGNLFTYNGSSWNENEVYVYLNGSWTRGRVYVYDGNDWIKSAQL